MLDNDNNLNPNSSLLAYFVAYRYGNHAGPSGYDRFADYLGKVVEVPQYLKTLGETLLRIPAKMYANRSGSFEYSRHDAIREFAVWLHMRNHVDSIYHFLYAEKSLRYLGGKNRIRGNRVVGSFHHCAFKYTSYFKSTKHFANVDHAVVVSSIQLEHMERIVGKGKVSVVPYAVDANYFTPATVKFDRALRCTCVGQHLRDYESLRQIIPKVRSVIPEVEFYVIGANDEFSDLKLLPGVIFKKGISDVEYLDILRQSDLLVLPLLDSTSVTTVNEALACGLPIVTNVGGVSDYLTDQCAIEHKVGDVEGMVHSVVDLLRDEKVRSTMSVASRKQGLELHWTKSAAKMAQVYQMLR